MEPWIEKPPNENYLRVSDINIIFETYPVDTIYQRCFIIFFTGSIIITYSKTTHKQHED